MQTHSTFIIIMTTMKIQFQLQMNLFIPFKTTQREHVVILPQLVAELND